MIVGQDILDNEYIKNGQKENLKHGTYDLTVGEIVPIGKQAIKERIKNPGLKTYYLEPREMVWVLSKEEFNMPPTVTGLATLRTTFTKAGILALNVGIIDPVFKGPISTALINFSDIPRRVEVGQKFFRIAFFEHEDVSNYHQKDENTDSENYLKHLIDVSYSEFSPSFLNIPNFDDEYYYHRFWKILRKGIFEKKLISAPLTLFTILLLWFLVDQGFDDFVIQKWILAGDIISKFKFW